MLEAVEKPATTGRPVANSVVIGFYIRRETVQIRRKKPLVNIAENHTHWQGKQSLLFSDSTRVSKASVDTFAFLDHGLSLSLVEATQVKELGVEGVTTKV